ncbi:M20/M25/M40 family metallo-hydrolase, partial [bacterium]|nr:M20/M25/M40 family metallo-hydrolase [bacterium]
MSSKIGFVILLLFMSCTLLEAEEPQLQNIRQLTFGGENAEAYFSHDDSQLIFQSTRDNDPCDQIYIMNIDGSGIRRISKGGRTTCSYFFPDGKRLLYSSTHRVSPDCPPPADRSKGYVWPLYSSYDIYSTATDGSELTPLAASLGYDAEATISPDGNKIVFTSDRDGDLELYVMNADGSNVTRVTNSPGYDGGAFFSPDSKQIVYRAHPISDEKELSEFRDLLKQHLVRPTKLEIYVMDADGSNVRQVTSNGAANFCPYFHPDGKRIIFSSNLHDPSGRNFDLYIIGTDGTGLKRITQNPTFDGFPMFSRDGKKLVFASNRNAKSQGETNIFIADWIESADSAQTSAQLSTESLKRHVELLASDQMRGRLAGTPESRKAAEYIANEFKQYALTPPPKTFSYFQEFEFSAGVKAGTTNTFAAQLPSGNTQYLFEKDFMPAGYSDDSSLQDLPVFFAGYGPSVTSLTDEGFANMDVKGKAVIVLPDEPDTKDSKIQVPQYYSIRYKAMVARDAGASALLVATDSDKDEDMPKLRLDRNPGTSGLAVLYVRRSILAEWLRNANKNFPDPKNPHSESAFELPEIKISLQVQLIREKAKSENVLGFLAASPVTEQTVIIGAHYDHLGTGIEGSLAPKSGEVHNGADDNASGVAALLEIARTLSANPQAFSKNLLFIAFGGEELGVLGSSEFVKNPAIPLKNVIAMLNMDMIGRLRDGRLVIGGTGTSPLWKELLVDSIPDALKLVFNESGSGPSDHMSFYSKDIPVLFFFTGAHAQYHRPEDDPKTIYYEGLNTVAGYIYRVISQIQNHSEAPKFTRVKSSREEMASRGGLRAYLGTIPDYAEEIKGVKLTG